MDSVPSLPTPPPSRAVDEEQIVQALIALAMAFATFNAEGLRALYTPDADWIDASGTALHGRDAIIDHLRELFADPHVCAGSLVGAPKLSLRWIDDDAVIATTYVERRSQQTVDGRTLPRRRTHTLKVLARSEQGVWLITSDIHADAHDPRDNGPPT
jgi:uncharacterized protein (TIGR02246 family)